MATSRLWDPFADHHRANPYLMYERLRVESPIHRSQSGDLVLTRYADIRNVLQNTEDFRAGNRKEWIERQVTYLHNKGEDFKAVTDAMNSFIVMMNPPEHTQLRAIIMEAWDDHDVDLIIKSNIDELLLSCGKSFDLVKDFAEPLPVMTMTRIMGMPHKDYNFLKQVATGVLRSLDMYTSFKDLVKIDAASKQFMEYLNRYLDYREANPSTDLVSKIVRQYQQKNIPVSRKQMLSICIFLFMAGEETTVNLIGSGLYTLLNHPQQHSALVSDPALLDNAVDEALRYESPVQLVGRIASRDLELNGVAIKKEDTLTLSLGAANRIRKCLLNQINLTSIEMQSTTLPLVPAFTFAWDRGWQRNSGSWRC
ncbi:MAG: cytochrome P450 [Cyclobacteriaceae bacterium]